jgi:uncharacterized protein involved in exopolysaccharide biosynthesis
MGAHQDRVFDELRSTVHEYTRILRRRWRLALLGGCVISSIAFWVSQYVPRQYSTTTIFERRDDAVLRNLIQSNSPYSFEQLKSSITIDMTGSRALAEAAVSIGLLPADAITSEQALSNPELRRLDEALSAHNLETSVRLLHSSPSLDTIELSCRASDPKIASRYVVALRDNYIRRTRDRITGILSGTRDFFAEESQRFQQRVNAAERQLQEPFAQFPGVDPTDVVSVGARLEDLRTEHLRGAERKAEIQAQITAREQFLASALPSASVEAPAEPPRAPPAPPILPNTGSAIDRAINQVEQELADAIVVRRMTEEHPTVRALRRKLESLHAARHATLGPTAEADSAAGTESDAARRLRQRDPVLAGQRLRVELELDALRPQLRIAEQRLEESQVRVDRFAALYARLLDGSDKMQQLRDRLEQDATTAAVWQQHLARLERILAAESEQRGTQFALVEEPKRNMKAVRPRAAAVFIVCVGCGLAAAALLLALTELTDRSFRSAGQVTRALGLPVLERIGVINTPRVRRQQLLRRLAWTPALWILLAAVSANASLAYASLEYPDLHRRAIAKLDRAMEAVGLPPTSLAQPSQQ